MNVNTSMLVLQLDPKDLVCFKKWDLCDCADDARNAIHDRYRDELNRACKTDKIKEMFPLQDGKFCFINIDLSIIAVAYYKSEDDFDSKNKYIDGLYDFFYSFSLQLPDRYCVFNMNIDIDTHKKVDELNLRIELDVRVNLRNKES